MVATAPAPPPLIERVHAVLGCRMVVRYAMTESPSISGTEPEDSDEVRARTVGRAQVGMAIRVLDRERRPCAVGDVGVIEVPGACVIRGYWGAPELTAEALGPDGWLRTNDTGFLDQAGNLVLVGRLSEMYIRGGYNVYPLEVENVLLERPGVAEVAIIGMPAPVIGEIGVAFVVPRRSRRHHAPGELAACVKRPPRRLQGPDEYRLLAALPRTRMLKVDKDALRASWQTRRRPPAGREASSMDDRALIERLPEEEQAIVELVARFVDERVRPVAQELEATNSYPEALIEEMKQLGDLRAVIPEPWGELKVSTPCFALVTEELARGWMSLAGAFGGHSVVANLLVRFGTEEQRQPTSRDGHGRAPGHDGPDRTRRRLGPPGDADRGPARGRGVGDRRHEDLDHELEAGGADRPALQDRSRRPSRANAASRCCSSRRWRAHGLEGSAQARLQGRGELRAALRRGSGARARRPRGQRGSRASPR